MSRFIRCEIDGKSKTVYQYLFGSQLSEAHRIYEEFGIGEYHPFCYDYEGTEEDEVQPRCKYLPTRQGAEGDILILNREDLGTLHVDDQGYSRLHAETFLPRKVRF
jgi:hypothetical protein